MKELLIYIDPGFLENAGHYSRLAELIHAEASRRNVELWHFVSGDVSQTAIDRYNLERLFFHKAILKEINHEQIRFTSPSKLRTLFALKMMLDPLRRFILKHKIHLPVQYPSVLEDRALLMDKEQITLESFAEQLNSICERARAERSDSPKISLFMYTSHPLYLPIFAHLLDRNEYRNLNIDAHLCLFYLNPEFCRGEESPEYQELLRTTSAILEMRDSRHKIRLYVDSERTQRRYRPYFKRDLTIIPVPVLSPGDKRAQSAGRPAGTVTLGYFGHASEKQGYHHVRRLYDDLVLRGRNDSVRFIVRHNTFVMDRGMDRPVAEFMKETVRIEHSVGSLSRSEYEELISRCDIILLPYSRNQYPTQTSGMLVEAIAAGRIVVVPNDTWLSDQLSRHGSGEVFSGEGYENFAEAVNRIVSRLDEYRANAGREFLKYHTVENLFNILGIATPVEGRRGHRSKRTSRALSPAASFEDNDYTFARLKNIHRGQRCFIAGNGPSLNRMDLSKLASEYVICSNAFFLIYPRISWRPKFYTAADTRVIPDRAHDIMRMHEENPDMLLFFPKELRNHQTGDVVPTTDIIKPARNRLYFNQVEPTDEDLPFSAFSLEAEKHLIQPYTVTITALQLAVFLGFDPIYLIGCDTDYKIPSTVLKEGDETPDGKMFFTSTADDDPNHFAPEYFGKGRKWHNPRVDRMLWHYRMAHEATAVYGRHVFNATVGGKLEEFPRKRYEEILG